MSHCLVLQVSASGDVCRSVFLLPKKISVTPKEPDAEAAGEGHMHWESYI